MAEKLIMTCFDIHMTTCEHHKEKFLTPAGAKELLKGLEHSAKLIDEKRERVAGLGSIQFSILESIKLLREVAGE